MERFVEALAESTGRAAGALRGTGPGSVRHRTRAAPAFSTAAVPASAEDVLMVPAWVAGLLGIGDQAPGTVEAGARARSRAHDPAAVPSAAAPSPDDCDGTGDDEIDYILLPCSFSIGHR